MLTVILEPVVPPTIAADTFTPNPLAKYFVPDESVAAYKAATNWVALSS